MVIGDLLEEAALKLEKNGIGDSYNEALILLTYALGCNRTYIYVHRNEEISRESENTCREYIDRRSTGEPTAYIAGKAWFMGHEFDVNPSVLIPRPETEGLAETALRLIHENNMKNPLVLDLCTGSGCIGISVACSADDSIVDLADVDANALDVAVGNIRKHSLDNRVSTVKSDLFDGIENKRYDLIVSNPPYVKDGDTEYLSYEVRQYEPHIALFAGKDGMTFYKRIIKGALSYMNMNSFLVLEAGFGQAGEISSELVNGGFDVVSVENDINGTPRIITAKPGKREPNL